MPEAIPENRKLHLVIHEPEISTRSSFKGFEGFPRVIREFSLQAAEIVLSNKYSTSIVLNGNHIGKSLVRGDDIPGIFYSLHVFDEDIAQNTGIIFEIQSSKHMDDMCSWKHETISVALDGSKIVLETLVDDSDNTSVYIHYMHYFNSPFNIQTPINEIRRDYLTDRDIIYLNVVLGNFE
jgi:hypothetical protein